MLIQKITTGFVIQTFKEDGTFCGQEFIDGSWEFEDENGETIDESSCPEGCVSFETLVRPFSMVQHFEVEAALEDEGAIVQCVKCGVDCEAWEERSVTSVFTWDDKEVKPGFLCEDCDCAYSHILTGDDPIDFRNED